MTLTPLTRRREAAAVVKATIDLLIVLVVEGLWTEHLRAQRTGEALGVNLRVFELATSSSSWCQYLFAQHGYVGATKRFATFVTDQAEAGEVARLAAYLLLSICRFGCKEPGLHVLAAVLYRVGRRKAIEQRDGPRRRNRTGAT
jgi:hypothetical protein